MWDTRLEDGKMKKRKEERNSFASGMLMSKLE